MNSKPVLMIHQITEEMLDLPLEDYTLTFDDGTIDHYEYFERFKAIPTEKFYFVITSRIGTPGYLTLDQLKEMICDPLVTIGGHSHTHTRINDMTLLRLTYHVREDTTSMLEWFKDNLKIRPTAFCFPYNYDREGIYRGLLRTTGFNDFYDHTRLAVESLILNTALSPSA